MNHINAIAGMLTEDPDLFNKSVIIAVHPDHVVDAAAAASSVYGQNPETYGPHRLRILKSYVDNFKRFIAAHRNRGTEIIITLMGKPAQLDDWYDERAHWDKNVDRIKMGMEQEEVGQLHQDLLDFIYQAAENPNFHVVPEAYAGAACNQGELNHILKDADKLIIIGGNLTGCLENTVNYLAKHPNGPEIEIIKELTFDDNPNFWGRHLPTDGAPAV